MEENKDFEIDLVDLFFYLKKWAALILVATLLFGIIGYAGTKLFGTPVYQTDVKLFTVSGSNNSNLTYTDFQVATQIGNDLEILAKSRSVTGQVVRELNLNMSDKTLANSISVSSVDNTRVVTLSITASDPQLAADIINCVAKYTVQTVNGYYGNGNVVKIVDSAVVPAAPVGPSAGRNAVLAAAAAFVIMVVALTVIRVLDSSIRTEEDVERYLGLSTLGVIPVSDQLEAISGQKKKRDPLQRLLRAQKPAKAQRNKK